MVFLQQRPKVPVFIKFLLAGLPGTFTALALIWLFAVRLQWPHPKAVLVAGILGHFVGFFPQKVWVFKDVLWSNAPWEFAKYMSTGIISAIIAYYTVEYADQVVELKPFYVPIKMAVDALSTIASFFINKFFIFIIPKTAQRAI